MENKKNTYLGIARKFRPQVFEQIVGQEHITTTLKNAIINEKVVPAYLFCGPRGTGKTTTARIFAKCLACESFEKPTINPCNKCPTCTEISEGRGLDIIEMDGASNRGIDEVRDLREKVCFAPARSRCKVYIIDEVHMLTTEAFNALLKTLEEPPLHVRFIFATTNPYKIPGTILSRCQRFNFKRLTTPQIVESLKNVAFVEKAEVEENCFYQIAKASDGAIRDAQVILDQMISYGKGKVTLKCITEVLGLLDSSIVMQASQDIIDCNIAPVINIVQKILEEGKDTEQFLFALIQHFRTVLFFQQTGDMIFEGADIEPAQMDLCRQQAKTLTFEELYYILEVLIAAQFQQKSGMARIVLEIALIRITQRGNILALPEILKHINSLNTYTDKINVKQVTGASYQNQEVKEQPVKSSPVVFFDISLNWQKILEELKKQVPSAAVFLSKSRIVSSRNDNLMIEIQGGKEAVFAKQNLEKQENNKKIEGVVSKITGKNIKISFCLSSSECKTEPSIKSDAVVEEFQKVFNDNIRIKKQ
ncbi:hypothetical protein B9J78_06535 [bacterium Unc6]|nr:hypothetical protein [bacterium Unc6]